MKEIPGYEGLYSCDEYGNIYALARSFMKDGCWGKKVLYRKKEQKIRACTQKHGYLQVALRKDGIHKSFLVHRLISTTFLGLKSDQEINHKDGDKKNNHLSNLEIVSRSENIKHAFATGLRSHKGKDHPGYRITDEMKTDIRNLLSEGLSQELIGKRMGISQVAVSKIKLGKS